MKTKYATRLNDNCNCRDCREAKKKIAFEMRILIVSMIGIALAVATSKLWL